MSDSPSFMPLKTQVTRRRFVESILYSALAAPVAQTFSINVLGANEKLNIASVGVGGKGWGDMVETSKGQNVVAVCDIDEQRLARAKERYPGAKAYMDWRKLLEQKDIDAVTVSTPDHTHAPVAMSAMSLGKGVYCQKPLTHDVYEARQLARAAAQYRVVTQMGTQHHSLPQFKTTVKLIQEGAIGKVKSAHVWTDRPLGFWKQGLPRPKGSHPIPDHLRWYLWLGTAPDRPFIEGSYHPFHWRGFWDFGTGALGDMGCHGMNPVVNALALGAPYRVSAKHSCDNGETAPEWSILNYQFPQTTLTTSDFEMVWYDGGKAPPLELLQAPASFAMTQNGILFVGTKGNLYVEYEKGPFLWPESQFKDYSFEMEPADDHYMQWTRACLGTGVATCPFSYAGPLTETVLLGNVAIRAGTPIEWDSASLTVKNNPEANAFLRRTYRQGWEVPGLS